MELEPKPGALKPVEATIIDLISQSEFKSPEKSAMLHTLLENVKNGKINEDQARETLEKIYRP
jgi:hypothetical protein